MAKTEAEKAEAQRRKAVAEQAKAGTDEARKRSEETLKEQEGMKPEPSQEAADRMKTGVYLGNEEEVEQPDGPAKRAADDVAAANEKAAAASGSALYKTRDAKG